MGLGLGLCRPHWDPMAGSHTAPPRHPNTQPCRPVPRVHAFGKGGQAVRRDPRAPPAMRGWLHKQDSSGLRLWKRRWFVLVDLCLYYYRDSSEQRVRGGLPLPSYRIRVLGPSSGAPRFLFTAEHPGMRPYVFGVDSPAELSAWVGALRRCAAPLGGPAPPPLPPSPPEPRPPGGSTNQRQPPASPRGGRGTAGEDPAANRAPSSASDPSDWLRATEGGAGGAARRPIRITVLQASF
ncbi:pleckstrin homology domain-containing family A member 4-like isoform X1 [Anas acuta]|uniref:pleckstrin homology domain-containing family A member 4-like isoform X1 n=2 Tax=Anas acuta TaxID=28680 RepID=UPI0035C93BD3